MKTRHSATLRTATLSAVAAIAIAGLFLVLVGAHSADHPKPAFNSKGELIRPEGYREWV